MPLESGQSLSHYRLLKKIGEGGMGVVWRARDDKLRRDVALKLLPADLVQDPERRRRFVREARTAAAVNHPSIAMVFEVDEAGDSIFIAMELVEGKTLRRVLGGTHLAISEALRIGAAVADGLASAHRARVIHRDLKPENVLIRPDGHVKILDFGLAKLHEERQADSLRDSQMETQTQQMTREGKILGTPAYMSPEQAKGELVDIRTDVFSFGSMLYELVTGRTPFQGTSSIETLGAILHKPVIAASEWNPEVPAGLDRILGKCLEKNREERYQDAGDLVVDLRRLAKELESGTLPSYEQPRRRVERPATAWRWTLAAALGAMLLALGVWQVSSWMGPDVDPRTVLILPLEMRGEEPGVASTGRVLAQALAMNLVQAENLEVLQVPEPGELGEGGTRARSRAAVEMGAGRLVTGTVSREGDTVHANLRLVDSSANRILWGTEREASGNNALRILAAELYRAVADELGATLAELYENPWHTVSRNPELARSPVYLEALSMVQNWDFSEDSLQVAENLVEAFPDEPDALLVAQQIFHNVDAREKGKEILAHVFEIDPDAPWEAYYRGVGLQHKGSPAIDAYTEILERDDLAPSLRAEIMISRGWLLVQEDLDRAAGFRDLEEGLRLDPAYWKAHRFLGGFLMEEWRLEEALAHYRQAFAIAPSGNGVRSGLAVLLFWTQRWNEAVPHMQAICETRKTQNWCAQQAYALYRAGREQEALDVAEVADAMEDTGWGTQVLARYRALTGDAAAVIGLFRRHMKVVPDPNLCFTGHCVGAEDLNSLRGDPEFEALLAEEWQKAVGHYGELCAAEPSDRQGHQQQVNCAYYAVALHLTGREVEAQEAAAKAASLDAALAQEVGGQERALGVILLAWYHSFAKNREEAIDFVRRRAEIAGPIPGWKLGEHRGFEWLSGDPEFEALVAQLGQRGPERSRQ
jgi:tetratricopeptide (TPR) repeat protein